MNETKKITKGDIIRSMNNDELADYLRDNDFCPDYGEICLPGWYIECMRAGRECKECLKNWLDKEAE